MTGRGGRIDLRPRRSTENGSPRVRYDQWPESVRDVTRREIRKGMVQVPPASVTGNLGDPYKLDKKNADGKKPRSMLDRLNSKEFSPDQAEENPELVFFCGGFCSLSGAGRRNWRAIKAPVASTATVDQATVRRG